MIALHWTLAAPFGAEASVKELVRVKIKRAMAMIGFSITHKHLYFWMI